METDPQTISAYLIYLSQHAPVEEQASHNDLALVGLAASCVNLSIMYLSLMALVHSELWSHRFFPLRLAF